MEKQSETDYEPDLDSSPRDAKPQQQKTPTMIDNNREIAKRTYGSQGEIRNQRLSLSNNDQKLKFTEIEDRLLYIDLCIEDLRMLLEALTNKNEIMIEYITGKIKLSDDIIEILNVDENLRPRLTSFIQIFKESQNKLSEMYNKVILGQKIVNNFREYFCEEVVNEKMELAVLLKLNSDLSLDAETKFEQFNDQILQMIQLIHEIDCEQLVSDRVIRENQRNDKEKIDKLLSEVTKIFEGHSDMNDMKQGASPNR